MRPLAASIAVALALAPLACVDPTPIIVPPPEAGSPAADASVDGGFDLAACTACLMAPDMPGPGCADEVNACQAKTTCADAIDCLTETNCYGRTSASFIQCAIPCADEAGLSIGGGASYTAAIGLFGCIANGVCAPKCIVK
jgi:hypothetical protein